MSFPPRFLDDLRNRILLSDLIARKVKLSRRGHEFTGLCPFHNEKTPSFTINDEKGFYHCFGCGAHGDIVRFMMETEKMTFVEAVEYLAQMAGLPLPKASPEQMKREYRRHGLTDIMEAACLFFQTQLFGPNGAKARQYLGSRGITPALAKRFRLGYAPKGSALFAHLTEKKYPLSECINLGLIVEGHENHARHDYFYDRIMFPILDRRRRVIAFGGRLMAKGEPKYLNSPETDLFHKGEQLYALPNAIDTIRKTNQAILVEGYMDVISLHEAGFTNAVAPLGTAFTENQLGLLWQITDEPIICFDGDNAGRKASIRALNKALPLLKPGKSLRFVFLPDTFDPDDMIRKKSPEAFKSAVQGAKSVIDTLWMTLLEGRSLDTPERMAKLEQDATESVQTIQNEAVRKRYLKEIKNRIWRLNQKRSNRNLSLTGFQSISRPLPDLGSGKMLLSYLICYPHLAQFFLEEISSMRPQEKDLDNLLNQILETLLEKPETTSLELQETIPEELKNQLLPEIEMLKKSNRTDSDVRAELQQFLQALRLKALHREKQLKTQSYLADHNPETYHQIKYIEEEIEKLSEII